MFENYRKEEKMSENSILTSSRVRAAPLNWWKCKTILSKKIISSYFLEKLEKLELSFFLEKSEKLVTFRLPNFS